MSRSVRPALCLLLLISLFLCLSCSGGDEKPGSEAGQKGGNGGGTEKELFFTTLRGNRVPLTQFGGRIVFMSFFATWNRASVEQLEELSTLYEKYRKHGVSVIGVCMDEKPVSVLEVFIEKHGIKFPIYTNGREVSAYFGGIGRTPSTLILKRDGSLYKRFFGKRSYKFLNDRLVEMLSHRM